MKYRKLRSDELAELEKEFVRFLAAQSIPADDWVKIKKEEPGKAERIIEIFSDFVFEQTLDKVEYLEFKSPKDIKTFYCGEQKMVLNGLRVDGASSIDFTADLSAEQMIGLVRLAEARVKLYTAEKEYSVGRNLELFRLMESGARISRDGALFKLLEGLKS